MKQLKQEIKAMTAAMRTITFSCLQNYLLPGALQMVEVIDLPHAIKMPKLHICAD